MVYITGDTHGDFRRVAYFCDTQHTSRDDILIVLGDAGINYYRRWKDMHLKEQLAKLPITLFCIHGNHEIRPHKVASYHTADWHGGQVYLEDAYPNILFGIDGNIYTIAEYRCVVIGGAYSVDKDYRLINGWGWWADEQPSPEIKAFVEEQLRICKYQVDAVLSHTCPLKYEPIEVFLPGIDQSDVDKSTEEWLDTIEDNLTYKQWFCGHYHTDKQVDRIRFLYETIEPFSVFE